MGIRIGRAAWATMLGGFIGAACVPGWTPLSGAGGAGSSSATTGHASGGATTSSTQGAGGMTTSTGAGGATTGPGGSGGVGGVGGTGGAGGSSGLGGAGSLSACEVVGDCKGYIDLVDSEETGTVHMTSHCGAGAAGTPVGYVVCPLKTVPPRPNALVIAGCVSANQDSQGISIAVSGAYLPDTYTDAGVNYTDDNGLEWTESGAAWVSITNFCGDSGHDMIEGTFATTVQDDGGAPRVIGGHFQVCFESHVCQELEPSTSVGSGVFY